MVNISMPTVVWGAALGLLGVGLYALLASRNLIKVIIGLQLVVKGAMLALVLAGRLSGQENIGQLMALIVIVADTIVAVLGLAMAVQVRKLFGTLDTKSLTSLRR